MPEIVLVLTTYSEALTSETSCISVREFRKEGPYWAKPGRSITIKVNFASWHNYGLIFTDLILDLILLITFLPDWISIWICFHFAWPSAGCWSDRVPQPSTFYKVRVLQNSLIILFMCHSLKHNEDSGAQYSTIFYNTINIGRASKGRTTYPIPNIWRFRSV